MANTYTSLHYHFVFILLACSLTITHAQVVEESIEYSGVKFRVVRLEPNQVQPVWNDETGQPYRTFDRVQAAFAKQGKTVKFITNAGIFEPGGIPSGLHVEDGRTRADGSSPSLTRGKW